MITRVLYPANIHVNPPNVDGVSPQEAIERLLEAQNVIQGRQGEVSSDEGGLLQSGDDFSAHRVWYLEECGLNVPPLWPLTCNWSYHSMCPFGCSGGCSQAHDVLPEAVFEIHRVRDFFLCQ